ncbi:MAG: leucine-rich repeat protein [Ruminococcus sp.]|nr:leucine-rich repeat protein [Ruminococcus sp.]
MKKIPLFVTALSMLFSPLTSNAEETVFSEKSGNNTFYYTVDSHFSATITESDINDSNITVPSVLGGYPVMTIGEKAFFGKTSITDIKLPESITHIGENAFSGCLMLKSIRIPETVIYLGAGCFTGCIFLEKVSLDCSLATIPENCFSACSSLEIINIPESVMIIGKEAFFGCPMISGIFVPPTVIDIGENALGMRYNTRNNRIEAVSGFRIKGLPDTKAQSYAEENGIEFKYNNGDVNFDGFVDSVDSSAVLLEYSLMSTGNSGTFSDFQRIPADFNNDGFIDSVDASLILMEYAILQTTPEE